MEWTPIKKTLHDGGVQPHLRDYAKARASFSWEEIRDELDGLPGGRGLNIAYEAVDRHAAGPRGDHVALRWLGQEGDVLEFSYRALRKQSDRFANVLRALDVGEGETVFSFLGRVPYLYIAALGTLKNVSVFCPLFSAFGPEPVYQRLSRGDAAVVVTTERLYEKRIAGLRERLPHLRHVLLTDVQDDRADGVWSLPKRMREASASFTLPATDPEDLALLHFTSGTTGMPKGALHVHEAIVMHYMTGKYALDLHPDDVFWCTADPGWVTGTSYGIIAPFVHGVTNVVDEADFDAERWYHILEEQQVTVWYTAPTAIRMLMRVGGTPREGYDLSALRLVCSVGEPLNPEAVMWGQEALGLPIHDNWWQTETGGIMIANLPALDIRPGSMGRPLPGVDAAVVKRTDDQVEEMPPGEEGELALRIGWPSMFRGYLHEKKRYEDCFVGDWYLTGDLAREDADGYFWFVGRADDIIKTSGHMVSPFEVESALMEHDAVAEAGVIGKPDPVSGERVKAFVALNTSYTPSDELRLDLLGFARTKLGAAVAPKEIDFKDSLPKTKSGKIMRRLLKARELGLPEGDLSTLETASG
ncbi:MAG: acetate--CoA ligase [Bacteroidetes bacterium]|jgi:acetyl-CoA synthetase|nr:acetate--CoA ligase [Bacteroidota bacterium]